MTDPVAEPAQHMPTLDEYRAVERAQVGLLADDAQAARSLQSSLQREGLMLDADWNDEPGNEPAPPMDAAMWLVTRSLAEHLPRLRALRARLPAMPLLIACSPLRELDHVLALEMGADDVIDARWSAPVIAARLRALLRRAAGKRANTAEDVNQLSFGALQLQLHERRVTLQQHVVPLTEGEFEVLWLLACRAGQAVSRHELLHRVRGLDDHPMDRSIDSRIYRIRAKLGDTDAQHQRIRTVRNRGYVLAPTGW
jgi:DNA-binding response OmpR family regulator